MRPSWLLSLAALSLVPCLAAQEPAGDRSGDPAAEYRALLAEFNTALQAFFQKQQKAYEWGGVEALNRVRKEDPTRGFVPRFQDHAARHAATPAAIPALTWLLTRGQGEANDVSRDALANLVVDHPSSPDVEPAVLALEYAWRNVGRAEADEALAEFLANNEHVSVRAASLYVRSKIALQGTPDAATRAAALNDLREVIAMAPEASFAASAEGQIFEEENLQIGKQAPDIAGMDLDGVSFRLSDYHGKVVLLDFWGNW